MAILCLAEVAGGPPGAPRRIVVGYTRTRRSPCSRRELNGRRGDDRAAQRRAEAEPRADARGRARRSSTAARSRNIAHGCNSVIATQAGDGAGRLHRDRGRLRLRPRRREVLRHQVRLGRPRPGGRGHRRDGAGAQDARRSFEGHADRPGSDRRGARPPEPGEARREHRDLRGGAGRRLEPVRRRHGGGDRGRPARMRTAEGPVRRRGCLHEGGRGRGRPGRGRRRGCRARPGPVPAPLQTDRSRRR